MRYRVRQKLRDGCIDDCGLTSFSTSFWEDGRVIIKDESIGTPSEI